MPNGKILQLSSDTLSHTMRRRPSVSEVLARKIKEVGTDTEEIARRAKAKGYHISASTVRHILSGDTKNPQIFSLEAICEGMGISTLAFLKEIIGDKTDEANFKGSVFAALFDAYKEIPPAHRSKAEPHIDGLLLQLRHIKSQSK